jgi:hypothetical protein
MIDCGALVRMEGGGETAGRRGDGQAGVYTADANHQLAQSSFPLFLRVPCKRLDLLLHLLLKRVYRAGRAVRVARHDVCRVLARGAQASHGWK